MGKQKLVDNVWNQAVRKIDGKMRDVLIMPYNCNGKKCYKIKVLPEKSIVKGHMIFEYPSGFEEAEKYANKTKSRITLEIGNMNDLEKWMKLNQTDINIQLEPLDIDNIKNRFKSNKKVYVDYDYSGEWNLIFEDYYLKTHNLD